MYSAPHCIPIWRASKSGSRRFPVWWSVTRGLCGAEAPAWLFRMAAGLPLTAEAGFPGQASWRREKGREPGGSCGLCLSSQDCRTNYHPSSGLTQRRLTPSWSGGSEVQNQGVTGLGGSLGGSFLCCLQLLAFAGTLWCYLVSPRSLPLFAQGMSSVALPMMGSVIST